MVILDATFLLWLPSCKKQINHLLLSHDIADQRDTNSQTQPKVVASGATFPWWLIPIRIQLILSTEIDNQIILQSECKKDLKTTHNQKLFSDATSLDHYLRAKRVGYQLISYWWSKSSAVWLDKRYTWPHPSKSDSLRCYLLLMTFSMQRTEDMT